MAATQTVPQLSKLDKSSTELVPRNGVITLSGYGIKVIVDRGHLVLKDGIGFTRKHARFARVRHGLRRLVVIGSDGFVSFSAFRWLADQEASFVMLERDGHVLATTGPVRPSDVRLRRAQSLAHHSGTALLIAQSLIRQKLDGQERLVREMLNNPYAAKIIAQFRLAIGATKTIEAVRLAESKAASAYWSAWRDVPVTFPKYDKFRVPDHWRIFGTRSSPLTGSPRLAVNPANAMLNYLYALLEAEARIAAATLGLDPAMGVLHMDAPRDSLACDLMEVIRPSVDSYVLNWIMRQPVRREWFFEKRDGNCRLMASLTEQLSETSATWASAIGPVAESVAKMFWGTVQKPGRQILLATRLTQSRRREAKTGAFLSPRKPTQSPPGVCSGCGASIRRDKTYCMACGLVASTECLLRVAVRGRQAAQSSEAQASRSKTQRRNNLARYAWKDSDQPAWLTEKVYLEQIQPCLAAVTVPVLAEALRVSQPYATDIRAGRRQPHPRHWLTLANLVDVTG